MNPSTRVYAYFGTDVDSATYAAPAGNAQVAVKVSSKRSKVIIRSWHSVRKTGASATNNQPRVGNKTGFAAGDVNQRWRAAAATAPATAIHGTDLNHDTVTDADGYLYLVMDGDAADTFTWELGVEVLT